MNPSNSSDATKLYVIIWHQQEAGDIDGVYAKREDAERHVAEDERRSPSPGREARLSVEEWDLWSTFDAAVAFGEEQ